MSREKVFTPSLKIDFLPEERISYTYLKKITKKNIYNYGKKQFFKQKVSDTCLGNYFLILSRKS